MWPNFGNVIQTPFNYPVDDQIGVGADPKVAGSAPMYLWKNTSSKGSNDWPLAWKNVGNWTLNTETNGTPLGSTNIHIKALGWAYTANNYVSFSGDTNRYLLYANLAGTSTNLIIYPGLKQGLPTGTNIVSFGPIANYQAQTTNAAATFSMPNVIKADQDYFKGTNGVPFTGNGGVGVGTKAQMLAIAPSKANVGFWVTNEASWNTTLPANTSGQLYTWNGGAWALKYTPLTYPHPYSSSMGIAPPSNLQFVPGVK